MLVIGVFRHETLKEPLEIATRRGRGIFHQDEAAAGVLNENGRRSVVDFKSVDLLLNSVGDFVRSFPFCANEDLIVSNAHLAN